MKSLSLLTLFLVTAVLCDKKLNLEDIERDHLRSEISSGISSGGKKTTKETLRTEESKYSAKAEVSSQSQQQQQQPYHGPTAPPQELGNQVGDYAELQSYESFKYAAQPQDYSQDKYQQSDDANAYLQQSSGSLLTNPAEQQQQQQQQYYVQEGRSNSQSDYDALQQQQEQLQQQLYQQEVLVGNQLQTVQQKAVTHKYVDENENKGTYYVNIPMSQLLAYYQNYGIVQSKNKNAEQQISIPVYMPLLTQNQVYAPAKVTYQPELQYVSAYPKHTQAVFTKSSKSPAATAAPTVHASSSASSTTLAQQQVPMASQHQYTAPVELLTNQAYSSADYQPQKYQYYVTQQQPQYVQPHQQQQQQQQQQQEQQQQQQLVYENAAAYADIYNTPATAYVQDNSLYEQQQQQQQQHQSQAGHPHHQVQQEQQEQQYYVPTSLAEQYMTQLLQQAGIQNTEDILQHAVKQQESLQEPLHQKFAPPQYQAQKFRASHEVTHLVPVAGDGEGFGHHRAQQPVYSSASSALSQHHQQQRPKTLLDSYVPSHVIAAQDANRYRERPIKLESGFLPSKINFVHSYKKRKTE